MMGGVAFIFPGQGAQRSGMARDVYERFPAARRVFEEASDVLGYSMQELCFEPNDRLDLTAYTQPALLTASIALLEAFRCVASVASPRHIGPMPPPASALASTPPWYARARSIWPQPSTSLPSGAD